jgi:hypothetical protein
MHGSPGAADVVHRQLLVLAADCRIDINKENAEGSAPSFVIKYTPASYLALGRSDIMLAPSMVNAYLPLGRSL